METLPESAGRVAFGANVESYDNSRPAYPTWMFEILTRQNMLHSNAEILEIGAGSGLATRALLEAGACSLTLLEPDRRFAPLLESLGRVEGVRPTILYQTLEEAELPHHAFDLIVVATAFHWLDPKTRISKLSTLLKSGGSVVLLWNVFQDLRLEDSFHAATAELLAPLSPSPSGKPDSLPFALDRNAREQEFASTGFFDVQFYAESHWQLELDATGVRALYEGYSSISSLPEAERLELLDRLEMIAAADFGGRVIRNMTSPLYVFRRR